MSSPFDKIVFDNRALRQLPIDPETRNFVRQVSKCCFSRVQPTSINRPRLLLYSRSAMRLLGLRLPDPIAAATLSASATAAAAASSSPSSVPSASAVELHLQHRLDKNTADEMARYFSGNERLVGSDSCSHNYAGFQFGAFSGQLGDGAAISLGEVIAPMPPSEGPLLLDGFAAFVSAASQKHQHQQRNVTSSNNTSRAQQQQLLLQQHFLTASDAATEDHDFAASEAIIATTVRGCEGTALLPGTTAVPDEQLTAAQQSAAAAAAAAAQQKKNRDRGMSIAAPGGRRKNAQTEAEKAALQQQKQHNESQVEEYLTRPHMRWELQLKGAGPTPYSRSGDGRKVLRSSLREYLCSEAMFALNIPTTRAAALVVSGGDTVERDPMYQRQIVCEPVAVLTRLAPNFLRFGSFEICRRAASDAEGDDYDSSQRDDEETNADEEDGAAAAAAMYELVNRRTSFLDISGSSDATKNISGIVTSSAAATGATTTRMRSKMFSRTIDDTFANGATTRAGPSAEAGIAPILSLFEYMCRFYFPREWDLAREERERLRASSLTAVSSSLLGDISTGAEQVSSALQQRRALAAPLVLRTITRSTARLVAQWQCVGFVHGVLNTDNMSVLGMTIDYGPFAFMEYFDEDFVGNSSDHGGRYSYKNQPAMCRWNCYKLQEAFRQMFPDTVPAPRSEIDAWFDEAYAAERRNLLRAKLFGVLPGTEMAPATAPPNTAFSSLGTGLSVSAALSDLEKEDQKKRSTFAEHEAAAQRDIYEREWRTSVDKLDALLFQTLQDTAADFTRAFVYLEQLQESMVSALTHHVNAATSNDAAKSEMLLRKMELQTEERLRQLSGEMGSTALCPPLRIRSEVLQGRLQALRPQAAQSVLRQQLSATDAQLAAMYPHVPVSLLRVEFGRMLEQTEKFAATQKRFTDLRAKYGTPQASSLVAEQRRKQRLADDAAREEMERNRKILTRLPSSTSENDPPSQQQVGSTTNAGRKSAQQQQQQQQQQTSLSAAADRLKKEQNEERARKHREERARQLAAEMDQGDKQLTIDNTEKWYSFLKVFEKELRMSWMRSLPAHYTPSMLAVELDRRQHILRMSNPRFVLRNWIAQAAVDALSIQTSKNNNGNNSEEGVAFVYSLLERLENPHLTLADIRKRKKDAWLTGGGAAAAAAAAAASKSKSVDSNSGAGGDNNNNKDGSAAASGALTNNSSNISKSKAAASDQKDGSEKSGVADEKEDQAGAEDIFAGNPEDAHFVCVSCSS